MKESEPYMLVRFALLFCLVLGVGDCIAAGTARQEGCTLPLHWDRLFDDRLDWSRVSEDASGCYLEGYSEDQRLIEMQVRYLRTWAEDQCDVSLASAPHPPTAGYREQDGRGEEMEPPAFAIAIEAATAADCVVDGLDMGDSITWSPSVDISSRNLHPATHPAEAIEAGLSGTAMLVVWTRETGAFGGAIVSRSSGHPSLDAAAIEAAEHWAYNPGETDDGRPLPGHVAIPVDFTPSN
ncbi:energy transducer TonB [Luteimonas sp. SJ-92]|uniref:Energy transducer TonB n=1 Tax=Luteimonas salinisoli TaxID=2752307 RepID=A0A853JBH7_9GAMM|nr:energy transducer TonB [Luteimonas salinisoli]NZA26195.1 energy transducer TonB [Luteimonas salinisoli]